MVSATVSMVTTALPVPGEPVGGISVAPLRFALKVRVAAAAPTVVDNPKPAISTKSAAGRNEIHMGALPCLAPQGKCASYKVNRSYDSASASCIKLYISQVFGA
jgi:hypothetical protein